MITWADLHAGDVVQARTGGYWQVQRWEDVKAARWLGAGGGGRQRVFTLAPIDGSRPPVTAPHVLSDPVSRVFEYDRSAEQAAAMALAAQFSITLVEESLVTEPSPTQLACTHPDDAVSKLKGGKVICTECFATLFDPADHEPAPVDPATVAAPPGALDNIVPPYVGVDSSGIEYTIPARDRKGACDAGIHPKALLQFEGERMRGCGACGLMFPATEPQPDEATAVETWADLPDQLPMPGPVTVVEPAAVEPDVFADPAGSYEVKRDQWGRYLLPDPYEGHERPWTRASTLARALADEYNLTGWKLRMVAIGIARNADLAAGVLAIRDPEESESKKTLKELVGKAMERAESSRGATLGTALHNFTHRLDRGEPLAMLRAPEPLDKDLVEYQATLTRYGLGVVPDLIERIVVCPELGAAGTFDRILSQTPGPFSPCPLTVSDLKTGKTVEWSWLEWAIQLAIYANATHMWDPAAQAYIPMPPREVLDRDRALIVHLPVGKATGTVYGVNLIEGYEAAKLAERVRSIRNSGKGYGWSINPVNPEALLIYRVSQADGNELARLWDRHQPRGEWTPAVAHAAEERVARLQSVPM